MDVPFRFQEAVGLLFGTVVAAGIGVVLSTAIEGRIDWLLVIGATIGSLGAWLRTREKAIDRWREIQSE